MKIPTTNTSLKPESSFGLGNILGLIFILIGILLILSLQNFNFPIELGIFKTFLQYGAALGSILYGLLTLFKKKETTSI
jgi:hypothetical protein|tara:strand:+ start:300 stop:536 length:237 start_codon:yes stop_codon:yes gene_type:complete